MKLWREMAQQVSHVVVDRRRLDDVVLVEDQGDVVRQVLDLVYQGGRQSTARHDARRVQKRKDSVTDANSGAVERRDHLAPETGWIVVVWIEREPCDRPLRSSGPLGNQGRLAESGWRTNQHQLARHAAVERCGQAGSGEPLGTGARHAQLCG